MKWMHVFTSLLPALLALAILAGCTGSPAGSSSGSLAEQELVSVSEEAPELDAGSTKAAALPEDLSGSVTEIEAASEYDILLETSEGYLLYDAVSGDTLATLDTPDEENVILGGWQFLANGFSCQRSVWKNSSTVSEYYQVFYDENLQETGQVDLLELTSYAYMWEWAISDDSTLLAWYDYLSEKALYLYDRTTGTTTRLLSGDSDLTNIDSLYFDTDGSRLVFFGYEKGEDGSVTPVWGTVVLDGSDLRLHTISGITAGGYTKFQNGILLCQEESFSVTGKVCLIDVETEEETVYSLPSTEASEYPILLSPSGKYFVTGCAAEWPMDLQIYRVADGSLIGQCRADGSSRTYALLDDLNTLYVARTVDGTDTREVLQFSF